MSFFPSAKLYTRFEDSLLLDEVTGGTLSYSGSPPSVVAGFSGNALQLSTGTYLSTSQSLGITSAFTISFWLKPCHPGVAVTGTNSTTPLRMALLSKSGFSYSSGTTSLTNTGFVVWEECKAGGLNSMKVLVNGTSLSATVESQTYTSGDWHHFWVVYSGGGSTLKVYVDGDGGGTTTTGTVPPVMFTSTANFEINRNVAGSSYNVARNCGVLDELFVMNAPVDDTSEIARAIYLGADHVLDADLATVMEVYAGVLVNDPTTIRVGGVASNNSELFVGRSDGKLLRGYRSIWQHRRSFTGESEKALLEKKYNGSVAVTEGVLTPAVMIRS